VILESESGTYASTASAKKHARIAVEAPYVSTNTIVVFVNNVKEHPFAGMVCRNPDALFADKKLVLRMCKSMLKLHVIGGCCWFWFELTYASPLLNCSNLASLNATRQGCCGACELLLKNFGTTYPSSLSLGCKVTYRYGCFLGPSALQGKPAVATYPL
jgi:hypothetical protein